MLLERFRLLTAGVNISLKMVLQTTAANAQLYLWLLYPFSASNSNRKVVYRRAEVVATPAWQRRNPGIRHRHY